MLVAKNLDGLVALLLEHSDVELNYDRIVVHQ
jgi:hypothetical protein